MMLALIACVAGLFILNILAELLGKHKILKGEYRRKFLHITAGSFIAFWPWLISWRSIEIVGVAMLAVVVANRYRKFFSYNGRLGRRSYGDVCLALAVVLSAALTHNKIFFAVAILEVALADGLAAVAGEADGKNWGYKVLGYKKTVIGSMTFWLVSAAILGGGLIYANSIFSFQAYYLILLLVPPALMVIENFTLFGLDNVIIPLLAIVILRLIQS